MFVQADWALPKHIVAGFTTVESGNLSPWLPEGVANWERLNQQLQQTCKLPSSKPPFIRQQHGVTLLQLPQQIGEQGDACFTTEYNQVCAILTADCLPILLADKDAQWVAAIHAGWRSLAGNIIGKTLDQLSKSGKSSGSGCLAWIGAAISQPCFEVGGEVVEHFKDWSFVSLSALCKQSTGKYLVDLKSIAESQLKQYQVEVTRSDLCSHSDPDFFSYRKNPNTGRFASLIWIDKH